MQVLHLEVLIRKKLVDIRGKIHPKDICFADFLNAYRRPSDSPLIRLARWLRYQGNELEDSLLFTAIFLTAEMYSLFCLSANPAFEVIIMCSLAYALTFGSLLNFKFQLLTQFIAMAILIGILVLLFVTGVLSLFVVLGAVVALAAVMGGKLLVYLQEWLFADSPNFSYSLESNLLILIYIFWKEFQQQVAPDPATLLPAMAALALANTVKVYRLFDYNVLAVINIFSELNNRTHLESNANPSASLELPQAANILVQTKTDPIINSEAQQSGQKSQQVEQRSQNDSMSETLSKEQSTLGYESGKRIAISLLALLVFVGEVVFARFFAGDNLTNAYSFFFLNLAGATFLLMLCQYEKSVKSLEKQGLTYVLVAMVDAVLVLSAGGLAYSRSTLGLDIQSAIFYSVFPFLASKQFSSACAQVHTHLDNGKFTSYFLCFLMPFNIRAMALYAGWTFVVWLNDGLVCLLLVAGLWGNRAEVVDLLRDLRGAAASKKKKIKFLDRLKQTRANYSSIVQAFLYLHAIALISTYCFTTFTSSAYQVQYSILYISPLFLYFACLASTHSLSANRPQSYSPYLFTILALVLAVTYATMGCGGMLGTVHEKYSLLILLHALLFAALVQGEKIAVIRLPNYYSFIRALLVIIFFAFIYLPFISGFMAGYFFSDFSSTYFYYYTLGGFIYLWLVITAAGTAIHLVLNLTEKSKKDLFIAQYLESELKKILLKENVEKFLMISNMYEMLNENSEDLLHYLRAEKNVVVVVRREKEFAQDYELADPEDHPADRRLDVRARRVNPLDLVNLQKTEPIPTAAGQPDNPILAYFRDKERNRIEPVRPKDVNFGLLQLKSMGQKMRKTERDDKNLERSQDFKEMKTASAEAVAECFGRFYHFLSQPSECLSRETFFYLMRLLTREELGVEETGKVYDRFSDSLMNESQFKNFIVDYGEFRYDLRNAPLDRILRTICCYDLVPILAQQAQLDYHLRRKAVKLSADTWDIWLHDGSNQQTQIEFQTYRLKELQKKHNLLSKLAQKKVAEENDEEGMKVEEVAVAGPEQKRGSHRQTGKALLKDKILLKAENVYGVIVNAVTEGYMLYEKEAQIFQVKSIKASVSNLLALLTKVSDAIFVYGYSIVYLLFAYFKQDFTGSSYIFSGVNYIILLGLITGFTVIYIALILYHKRDFETGTLGLDAQHRSLTFCDFKFYTIQLLFLLGSALANYIISIGLNSFLCDPTSQQLLNFAGVDCFSTSQEVCLFASLLILVVYWPLSAITFPFSTAMDRSLEIKYKSQFEIVYLQFKFLINGCNTLLAPFVFRTQQLCISALKAVLCCALAILCYRLHPCSYALMNRIEGKVYILLTILSFAGTLCFFVGLLYSLLITGSVIALYLVYFIYSTVKVYQSQNEPREDDLIDDHLRNQRVKIKIIRHQAQDEDTPAALHIGAEQSNIQLIQSKEKESPELTHGTQQIKTSSDQATKKTFNFW